MLFERQLIKFNRWIFHTDIFILKKEEIQLLKVLKEQLKPTEQDQACLTQIEALWRDCFNFEETEDAVCFKQGISTYEEIRGNYKNEFICLASFLDVINKAKFFHQNTLNLTKVIFTYFLKLILMISEINQTSCPYTYKDGIEFLLKTTETVFNDSRIISCFSNDHAQCLQTLITKIRDYNDTLPIPIDGVIKESMNTIEQEMKNLVIRDLKMLCIFYYGSKLTKLPESCAGIRASILNTMPIGTFIQQASAFIDKTERDSLESFPFDKLKTPSVQAIEQCIDNNLNALVLWNHRLRSPSLLHSLIQKINPSQENTTIWATSSDTEEKEQACNILFAMTWFTELFLFLYHMVRITNQRLNNIGDLKFIQASDTHIALQYLITTLEQYAIEIYMVHNYIHRHTNRNKGPTHDIFILFETIKAGVRRIIEVAHRPLDIANRRIPELKYRARIRNEIYLSDMEQFCQLNGFNLNQLNKQPLERQSLYQANATKSICMEAKSDGPTTPSILHNPEPRRRPGEGSPIIENRLNIGDLSSREAGLGMTWGVTTKQYTTEIKKSGVHSTLINQSHRGAKIFIPTLLLALMTFPVVVPLIGSNVITLPAFLAVLGVGGPWIFAAMIASSIILAGCLIYAIWPREHTADCLTKPPGLKMNGSVRPNELPNQVSASNDPTITLPPAVTPALTALSQEDHKLTVRSLELPVSQTARLVQNTMPIVEEISSDAEDELPAPVVVSTNQTPSFFPTSSETVKKAYCDAICCTQISKLQDVENVLIQVALQIGAQNPYIVAQCLLKLSADDMPETEFIKAYVQNYELQQQMVNNLQTANTSPQ